MKINFCLTSSKNLVTSYTLLSITNHDDPAWLCFLTSSKVYFFVSASSILLLELTKWLHCACACVTSRPRLLGKSVRAKRITRQPKPLRTWEKQWIRNQLWSWTHSETLVINSCDSQIICRSNILNLDKGHPCVDFDKNRIKVKKTNEKTDQTRWKRLRYTISTNIQKIKYCKIIKLHGMTWYSLRKHPFLLALRRWGPRETSPAAKSEEKRMFSQARRGKVWLLRKKNRKKDSCASIIFGIMA